MNSAEYSIDIYDLTSQGLGVGALPGGMIAMIDGAIPGDRVHALIDQQVKRTLYGKVVAIEDPSPDRRSHPCQHYAEGCQGCKLGVMTEGAARKWKQTHLKQTLKRIGGLDIEVAEVVPSPVDWGYRDRIELHLEMNNEGRLLAGYRAKGRLIPIQNCLLADNAIQSKLPEVIEHLQRSQERLPRIKQARLTLKLAGEGRVFGWVEITLNDGKGLESWHTMLKELPLEGISGLIYRPRTPAPVRIKSGLHFGLVTHSAGKVTLPVSAFTQANQHLAPNLANYVVDKVPANGRLLDLYGGYGPYALEYTKRGGSAYVVEADSTAITGGVRLCEKIGLNVEFEENDLSQPGGLWRERGDFTAAVANPAHHGLDAQVTDWLFRNGPGTVVYVSCHPGSLARDLLLLPNYKVQSVQPFDMFPQTPELETVVVLHRK